MYLRHFNLTDLPFSIAPNPRYVYLSPQHQEALAHLLYGISVGGGFIALTGEVGTGKTTLCRCLLEQLPDDVDIALIFNPRLNARELLASICDELHLPHPGDKASIKRLIDLLTHHLLETHAQGRRTIVLIDEAQNLSFDVLEQIRLLTNLETNETKLLQIILVGQPELKSLLARQNLRQLSQRITARYHLNPLSFGETCAYIAHRLAVSGVSRRIFSRLAVARIFRLSGGIPRLINLICDRALLGAYTLGKTGVSAAIVGKAAREVLPEKAPRPLGMAIGALAMLTLAAGVYFNTALIASARSVFSKAAPGQSADGRPGEDRVKAGGPSAASALAPPADGISATKTDKEADGSPHPPESGTPQLAQQPVGAANPMSIEPASPPEARKSAESQPVATGLPESAKPTSGAPDDFEKLLADPGLTRSAAFARLYTLWGGKAPAGNYDECQVAKQQGLRCLFHKGDAAQLRALDHPAMLELVLPDGSNRYATLIRLEGEKWVLGMGERTLGVAEARVLPFWRGHFTLLWKPPGVGGGISKLGNNTETVRWIRQQLKEPGAAGKESFFDARLKERVMDFQHKHGLLADGEVGPMTMIRMEKAASRYDGPSLSKTYD